MTTKTYDINEVLKNADKETANKIKHVMAKYVNNPWWEQIDENCIIHQLNEPTLMIPFTDFHEGLENLLDRPIQTLEMLQPTFLMDEYKLKLAERIKAKVTTQLELTFKQDPLTDITMQRLNRDISNYLDKCIEEGTVIAQNTMRMTLSELLKQDETYKYLNYFVFVKANNATKEVRASVVELFYNTCTGNIHTVYNDLECLQTRYGTYREVEDELGEERRSQCDDYIVELFVAAHEEGMKRWQESTLNT